MIGLAFLAVGVGWLALSLWLARKLPSWVGVRHPVGKWLLGAGVITVFLIGPFIDHIVGMRQFERLCEESRINIWVSPDIDKVKRVRSTFPLYKDLSGYWIDIRKGDVEYIDLDTKKPLLQFREYFTKGGKVWGITLLGGEHSCNIEGSLKFTTIWNQYQLRTAIDAGYKK